MLSNEHKCVRMVLDDKFRHTRGQGVDSLKLSDNQNLMLQEIENTIEIINRFFNDDLLYYTALHNALLSLILLPFESAKKRDKKRIWQGAYEDMKREIGFKELIFEPIKACKDGKHEKEKKTIYSFIRKFRNAIAHQNITINVDKNRIIGIEIFNIFDYHSKDCSDKKKILDFKISFSYNQLHEFALYVANGYKRSILG